MSTHLQSLKRRVRALNGHLLEGDNLRISSKGGRICITCFNLANKKYRDEQAKIVAENVLRNLPK